MSSVLLKHVLVTLLLGSFGLKAQSGVSGNTSNSDMDAALYWTGTIVFSAINIPTSYFNIKKMHKADKYRSNAVFGAISGLAQTALGFANITSEYSDSFVPTGLNLGIGLFTLTTSILRLSAKAPAPENGVSLQFIYIPEGMARVPVTGFSLKKRF